MAPTPKEEEGIGESVSSSWELLVAYAKQETLGPLKGIGKRIGLGMLGALVAGIGVIELIIAMLRALQTTTGTTFTGSWSWVPYVITLLVAVAATAIVLKIIDGRRAEA